jgi:hypothetical protein
MAAGGAITCGGASRAMTGVTAVTVRTSRSANDASATTARIAAAATAHSTIAPNPNRAASILPPHAYTFRGSAA